MAKLKTQFNDLVSYQEPTTLFSKTHTIEIDLNDNQPIDLTQFNNYRIIFDANGTQLSGSLELNLPSNIQISVINLGGFEIDGGVLDWSTSSDNECIYQHNHYDPISGSGMINFGWGANYGFGSFSLVQFFLFTKLGKKVAIDTATQLEP